MLRLFLLLLGALLCLDTVFTLQISNPNLGILLPAILGLPLLLLGVFYGRTFFAGGAGRAVRLMLLFGYCAAALFFGSLSAFLYAQGHQKAAPGAQAVLVLGGGIRGERVSLSLANRLDTALGYLQENPAAVCFVSGGQAYGEDIPEALAMQRYLLAKGLEADRIVMESRAQSTRENFLFSAPLIRERCGENARVVYVTTAFHVYRAGRVAAAQGMAAEGLGAPGVWYITFNDYLRECVALFRYWTLGWV